MHVPHDPPREPPRNDHLAWSDVAVTYGLCLAIPVLFWIGANPVLGVAAGLGLGSLGVLVRRILGDLEYVREECCHVFQFGGRARLSLARRPQKG